MSDDERKRSPPQSERRTEDRSERERKPKRKDAGFKWKEKRRDGDDLSREKDSRRSYRDERRPRERSRSRERYRSRSRSPRRKDYDGRDRDRERDSYRADRDGRDSDRRDRRRIDEADRDQGDRREKKEKKVTPAAPAVPQQEMILVTVNDRLGTKKQIPCLPSDTIKDFKAVVAMMIGRRPHEILLKRQSERPFKDFLTLQDYGISNNVQLDLEVDTGD